jgi:hypothetical protein
MNKVTFGFDFEGQLVRGATGVGVPCGGLIPGTKARPVWIDANGVLAPDQKNAGPLLGHYGVQEDGVNIELNTPVTDSPQIATQDVGNAIRAATSFLRTYAPFKEFEFERRKVEPATYTGMKRGGLEWGANNCWHWGGSLADVPGANVFGCDPDYNAYSYWNSGSDAPNIPPSVEDLGGLRFAGFHLHVGYDVASCGIPVQMLVVVCDLLASVYGLRDTTERGNYYGRMGNFRHKPYGVEYRSMGASAAGLPARIRQVMHGVRGFLNAPHEEIAAMWEEVFDLAQNDVINNSGSWRPSKPLAAQLSKWVAWSEHREHFGLPA